MGVESVNGVAAGAALASGAVPAGPEGYIDKRELAKRLGRTPRSVDTYMAKGIVPFYKLGRTVAFKWSEVDEYIRAHYRCGVVRRGG